MEILNVLSLAIGMVTVYLVFALSVTACNEAIAAWLGSRGKWLRKGVGALLAGADDRDDATGLARADAVYKTPFIHYMHRAGRGKLPSYLPAWTLLQGMLYSVQSGQREALDTLDKLRSAAAALPEGSAIRVALLDLLAAGDTTVAQFQARFELWFDNFESQVMSWYRQKTQLVLAGLSMVVACGMNVDTLALINQLAMDPKLRNALVAQAEQLVQAKMATAASADGADGADSAGQAAAAPSAAATSCVASLRQGVGASAPADPAQVTLAVQRCVQRLGAGGLQIGWTAQAWDDARHDLTLALQKLAGLLISAFAISLGAPFWFDLLNKLVAVRAVGKNLVEQAADREKQDADQPTATPAAPRTP